MGENKGIHSASKNNQEWKERVTTIGRLKEWVECLCECVWLTSAAIALIG